MKKDKSKLHVPSRIFRRTFTNKQSGGLTSIDAFTSSLFYRIRALLKKLLKKYGSLKCQIVVAAKLHKRSNEGQLMKCEPHFASCMYNITFGRSIGKVIRKCFDEIICHYDAFTSHGSGWRLKKVTKLHLCVVRIKRNMFGGGSKCDLPPCLKAKRGILTLRSCPEGQCFAYACAASMLQITTHGSEVRQYKSVVKSFKCVHHPMALSDIRAFERTNGISVNVFGWNTKRSRMKVLYRSSMSVKQQKRNCDLLLYKGHYHVVRKLNALVVGKYGRYCYLCRKCFTVFSKSVYLKRHIKYCRKEKKQRYIVPKRGEQIQFTNFRHIFRKQFVYYADFETMTVNYRKKKGNKTYLTHKHVPVSFGIMRVSLNDNHTTQPYCYHGPNVMEKFFEYLFEETAVLNTIVTELKYPLSMEDEDKMLFAEQTECHMCHVPFSKRNRKVRDHNHLVRHRNFRNALCSLCNLTYASDDLRDIAVICHNASGYDSHLILSELNKMQTSLGAIRVIPRNLQRYLAFTLGMFKFIDSLQFLPASLDVLVHNLKENGVHLFEHTKKLGKEHHSLLMQKLSYPYTFCKKLEDYNHPRLPPREAFINKLKGERVIEEKEYLLAQTIYDTFACRTFLDYHILYLKTDICLLADVFENHRSMCMECYELDPAWYLSSSHFAKDAFLRSTNMKLDCLHELDMYDFFERGVRGGISTVSEKYCRANNIYMGEKYDPVKESVYILGLDAVNLYGWAMSSPLPYGQFRWETGSQDELTDKILKCKTDADIGYVAEVDLGYPESLHDETDDFPLSPEKINIKSHLLSPYSGSLRKSLQLPKHNDNIPKLAPNLFDKSNYVVHYRNLQYYLKRGMVLKKVHRVISFKQSRWLEPYIKGNTERRREAKTKFEQDFFKLCNNSVFGKMLENKRKRMKVSLVTSTNRFDDMASSPNLNAVRVFSDGLVGLHMNYTQIVLDSPVYAGFAILDLAKLFMYEFHELMTKKLYRREDIRLLFTDTDSFLFSIKTNDLYEDLEKIKHHMDTSNYPPDHPLYDASKKFVAGQMKDEYPPPHKIAVEFVGLKSKMYSVLDVNDERKIRAKGIPKASLHHVNHESYVHCLKTSSKLTSKIRAIRSYDHKMFTVKMNKSSLNPFCDKRHVLGCGIKTRAHGHFSNELGVVVENTATQHVNVESSKP